MTDTTPKDATESLDAKLQRVMDKAVRAGAIFAQLNQAHTDRIVKAVARAALGARVPLAKMAAEETGIGRWDHKVIKNFVASQMIYEDIKSIPTVGTISEDEASGILEIAQPVGPIFAVIPSTNPTSTVIFKILISLKTRNPIVISPHPRAIQCCAEAARICYEAALAEDAPEDCIQWFTECSMDLTHSMMSHPETALVLATGGSSLVKAAYGSGKPAYGVGPGNVPVYVEASADPAFAAEQVITSKTFDNGTICASEQALVVEKAIAAPFREALIAQKCYFLSPEEVEKILPVVYDEKRSLMNAAIVGKPATYLAELAGLDVPADTVLLIAPQECVGDAYPLSSEILAPILAYYEVEGFSHAVNRCIELNFHGGIGHTASIYSQDDEKICQFANLVNAGRIVLNTPSSQGGVGGIYNTLHTSFTLGCGTGGGNITTDNITVRHLLNIQRLARRRLNQRFFALDLAHVLDETVDADTLAREYNANY
jgi:acetaldehyde dehydrogenase/alcohol dehydrogenase